MTPANKAVLRQHLITLRRGLDRAGYQLSKVGSLLEDGELEQQRSLLRGSLASASVRLEMLRLAFEQKHSALPRSTKNNGPAVARAPFKSPAGN